MRRKCLVEEYTEAEKEAHRRANQSDDSKIQDLKDSNEDLKKKISDAKAKLKVLPPEQHNAIHRDISRLQQQLDVNNKKLSDLQLNKAKLQQIDRQKKSEEIVDDQEKEAAEQGSGVASDAAKQIGMSVVTDKAREFVGRASLKTVGGAGLLALGAYTAYKAWKYWKQKRAEAKTAEDKKRAEDKMAAEKEKMEKYKK